MTTFSEKHQTRLTDGSSDPDGDPVSLYKINGNIPISWPHTVILPNGQAMVSSDGTVVFDDSGDTSSHPIFGQNATNGSFTYTLWDGEEESPTYTATIQLNGTTNTAPTASGNLPDLSLTQNVAMSTVDLSVDFNDPDGGTLSFSLAPGTPELPAGLSLSSNGMLFGTPTTQTEAISIVARATDLGGLYADSVFSLTVLAQSGVADYVVTRGAETPPDHGSLQPVDANGNAITLTSYDGLQSGSLQGFSPSVSGGRLIFTGGTGAPDGAVLRVGSSVGLIDLEIQEVSGRRDVATKTEFDSLATTGSNYTTIAQTHVYFQPGNYGNLMQVRRRRVTNLLLEGSRAAVFGKWLFDDVWDNISVSNSEVITLKGVTVHRNDDPGNPDQSAVNLIEYKNHGGKLIVDDVLIKGRDVMNETQVAIDGGRIKGQHYDGLSVAGGANSWQSVIVRNSHFEGLNKALKLTAVVNAHAHNNTMQRVYEDYIAAIAINGTPPQSIEIKGNVLQHHLADEAGDLGNPHPDFLQFLGATAADKIWTNILIENNVFTAINSRGNPQGIYMDDVTSGWFEPTIRNNIILLPRSKRQGIAISKARNSLVEGNTVGSLTPYTATTTITKSTRIFITHDGGGNVIRRNIADLVDTPAASATNNVQLGEPSGSNIPYTVAFAGSDFSSPPTTIAALMARYTPAQGAIMAGTTFAVNSDKGCIDHNGNHVTV